MRKLTIFNNDDIEIDKVESSDNFALWLNGEIVKLAKNKQTLKKFIELNSIDLERL